MTSSVSNVSNSKSLPKYMFKSALLVSVGLSTLGLSSAAFAQDVPGDEIIVTGIRQSLENALNEKRESTNLIEVIVAEDIGKLPDQNLAEVLENIPGIQITRTAGVGTGVQIRGTNANRTELNGVSTVGAGSGRSGISFEDVPAGMIAGVEVVKSPVAKTIEGSVGGTINIRTIRPLDLDEGKALASLRIQGEDSSLSTEGIKPRISGTLGKKWSNDSGQEIAAVFSLSYSEQDAVSFRPRVDRDTLVAQGSGVAADGSPGPNFDYIGIQFLNQELENFEYETTNFSGSIEARPTNNVKLYLDTFFNNQDRTQDSSRIQGSGVSSLRFNNVPDVFETINYGSLDGRDLGSIQGALVGRITPNLARDDDDPNLRFSSDVGARLTNSTLVRGGAEWEGDRLSARVEASSSTSKTQNPNLSTTLNFINPNPLTPLDGRSNDNSVPFIYDLSDGLTFGVDFDSPFAPTVQDLLNPNNTVLDAVTVGDNRTDNKESAFRVDLSYNFEDSSIGSLIESVDFGYRYNKSSSDFTQVRSTFGTGAIANSPSGSLFSDLLVPGPSNFGDADGRALAFRNFLVVDPNRAFSDRAGVLATLQSALDSTPGGQAALANGGRLLRQANANPTASYDISEETNAFYAQANFDFDRVRGNFGLRYIDTDINSTGSTSANGVISPVSSEGGYDFVLPRANMVVDVTDDIILRAGYAQDIRRPDFNDLSLSVSFPTGPNNAVSIGNPNLAPERVSSFDIGAEWYFAPAATLSVGFFSKKRKDLFVAQLDDALEDANGFRDITAPCEGGGIFNPVPDRNVLSDTPGNGLCVPLQTIVNDTGDTTQKGVEVAFQYDFSNWEDTLGWASGFGVLANYTYQEFSGGETTQTASGRGQSILEASSGTTGTISAVQGLLDNSKNSYNVTAFYEKYGLSARARYTWRSDFRTLDTAAGASLNSTLGFPTVTGARGQLNAGINYDLTENFNIGVEAVNLTKSKIEQYCVNDGAQLCFQGLPDRRIIFGGSYKF